MTDNLTVSSMAKLHKAKELAAEIDGIEYPARGMDKFARKAHDLGLVIIYGMSDDLMEIVGAFSAELGAWEGREVLLAPTGPWEVPNFCGYDRDKAYKTACPYLQRERAKCMTVEQLWCAEENENGQPISWVYKTNIPHATFNIMEDGEIYCRGIVFHIDELKPKLDKDLHDLKALAWDATAQLRGECNDKLLDRIEAYMAAMDDRI